jgi:hypothetical protein
MQSAPQQDPNQAYQDAVQRALAQSRISAAQTQADANQLPAIQSGLSDIQENILKMFGQRSALIGGLTPGMVGPATTPAAATR